MNQALQTVARQYNISEWARHDTILTGLRPLDYATGGIPKGKIVEIYGTEDSGKSALALEIAHRVGGTVLYIDAECKLSPHMVPECGDLYVAYPRTMKDALEMCRIAAEAFDVIVLDTLEALPKSNEEIDWAVESGKAYDGEREKVLSTALPILNSVCHANGCTLILVNQMRNIPGIMYGNPEHSTGGRALRYYAALRLETRCTERMRNRGEVTGQSLLVSVTKNKYGAPLNRARLTLDYAAGVIE